MRRRDAICLALVGAALALGVLGVGGALRWVQAGVAALLALALIVQLFARRGLDRISPLLVLLGAAAVLTAVQLIPLPDGILDVLDATGNRLRNDGAAIAGTSPSHVISLDPAGSLRALTYFITLIGAASICLRFSASERGRYLLLAGVAIVCGLAAAITGAHTLLSADSLYGLYAPVHTHSTPVFGPLLNPNHLGGLMAMGAVLSLGLAFYAQQPAQLRTLWIVIGVGCVVVTAVTLSRGAIIGLCIGLVVTAVVLVTGRLGSSGMRPRHSFRRDLPIAIVVGLGVAVALYMSAGNVASQLQDTSLTEISKPVSKYAAWKSSVQLVRESPWVGIGRGAVETNLTRVHPGSAYFTFAELENEYLSAIVEWGIPGALLLAVIFGWCTLTAIRRWRDGPLAAAALGALAMILFQSGVDFGIELLGIALPTTIIASTVQLRPLRPVSSALRTRLLRASLVALLFGSTALLLLPVTSSVQEDHDALRGIEIPSQSQLREIIERHPLDYYGFARTADVMSRGGDVHAVQFLNQALALHPTHPGLHRLAARMLVGNKRYGQAAFEYSLAMQTDLTPRLLLDEIVTLIPDADDIALAIPTTYPQVDIMLHVLADIHRQDVAEKWLKRVADRPQHDMKVIDILYDLAMQRQDLDTAKWAAELRYNLAHTTTSRVKLAKVKFLRREFDDLLTDLADVKKWNGRKDEKAQAWMILCDVHIEQRDWDRALECVHHLDSSGLVVPGGGDTSQRLEIIDEQRTYETKMQAAEALERSIGSGSQHKPTTP